MIAARALMAAAVVAALAAPARAHESRSPLAVAVELSRGRVTAVVRYTVDVGQEARELREKFDRDADGALDAGERAALGAWLAEQAVRPVGLTLGGRTLALTAETLALEIPDGASASLAVVIRLWAKVKWAAGESRLVVAVEWRDPRAVTPVAVRVDRKAPLALPEGYAGGGASKGAPHEVVVRRGR